MRQGGPNHAFPGIVASISYFVWNHPVASLVLALLLLVVTILVVRLVWRTIRRLLTRPFTPG